MDIKIFYAAPYGDGSHIVGVEEKDGKKTVVLRDLCRSVAGETANLANAHYLDGTYKKGQNDYLDAVIDNIEHIKGWRI